MRKLSPWSDTVSVSLSETPTTPTLATTENYLALDDTVICSVGYTGNSKASIKIAEAVNDEPVKGKDGNVVVLMMSSGMETLSETIENINKNLYCKWSFEQSVECRRNPLFKSNGYSTGRQGRCMVRFCGC